MTTLAALTRATLLAALHSALFARVNESAPNVGALGTRHPDVTAWLTRTAEAQWLGAKLWTAALIARREAESPEEIARERTARAERRALEEMSS